MAKSTKRKSATKRKRVQPSPKHNSYPLESHLLEAEVDGAILDRLWSVVMSRRGADPTVSHSARLLARGRAKIAQKFGEEAVECLIEAVAANKPGVIAESADVLYHLMVLWVDAGVTPAEVWAELRRREGTSGIEEKASRPNDGGGSDDRPLAFGQQTTKIP
jgi:phosphoribosyl-ATP pyrophosphohydrolase